MAENMNTELLRAHDQRGAHKRKPISFPLHRDGSLCNNLLLYPYTLLGSTLYSGADLGLFLPEVTQAGSASIRRWHVHVFLYIREPEDPVLGISITLSNTVFYDSESRFIFHCLRARVGVTWS